MVNAVNPAPRTGQGNGAAWKLVGPWYRWAHPALPADGRVSRPAIQMLAGDDFVKAFLDKPQHTLKFDPVIDVVNHFDLVSALPGGALAGKISSLFAVNAKGDPAQPGDPPFRARPAPSTLRKLYQPTHDRHYLVCCELHCELPGFPRVLRGAVCQSGCVLRRRRSQVPASVTPAQIEAQTAPVRLAEAELLELQALAASASDPLAGVGLIAAALAREAILAQQAGVANFDALLAQKLAALAALRGGLEAWFQQQGISVAIDGWFPTLQDGRPSPLYGAWVELKNGADLADVTSGEKTYPLFPLVPDPREAHHDAAGRTMYYGTLPTTGLEHDANGQSRFDDLTTYELRCFVRAHHACPPKIGKTPDCNGAITWSLPTEAFRLAPAFDVLGSANRPITIHLPDLRELAAQAALRPKGRLSPVRMVQPQHLSPQIDGSNVTGGSTGGAAICSFSIPLITIIALFVLNLFLPIVVFVFQLWFLLVFRFCIPPQIKFSAGVDAALAVTPPHIDLDVDLAVKVGGLDQTALQLSALLGSSVKARIKEDTASSKDPDLGRFSNNALGPLDQSQQDAADLKADALGHLPPPPPVGTPLVYEAPVKPVWPTAGAAA